MTEKQPLLAPSACGRCVCHVLTGLGVCPACQVGIHAEVMEPMAAGATPWRNPA